MVIMFAVFVAVATIFTVCCGDVNDDMTELHRILDSGYDASIPPSYFTGKPTTAYVNVYLNTIGSINAASMDYTVDMFLREDWTDERLSQGTISEKIILSSMVDINKIWKPGLYFKNVKESHFHKVTRPNTFLNISPNGQIQSSMRLTLKLACHMDLRKYPQDIQTCYIKIAPYSYSVKALVLRWYSSTAVERDPDLQISEFSVSDVEINQDPCIDRYITGNFSCLDIKISLKRLYGYHLIQTYVPTIFIVMISWVSCWLDPGAIPARVTLGVTTLLTLTTLAAGVRAKLPPVSYVKAIDVWMGICTTFVFAALFEFTLVNYLSRKKDEFGEANLEKAKRWDKICRLLFPLLFILFNIIYWPVYTS